MSRKPKIPAEGKIKLLEKILRGEISLTEAGDFRKVVRSVISGGKKA